MNATFVQVTVNEIPAFLIDPASVEALFVDGPSAARIPKALDPAALAKLRAGLATTVSRLNPSQQRQLAGRLGLTPEALLSDGPEAVLATLRIGTEVPPRAAGTDAAPRDVLELEKAWHAVHYVLCGEVVPGPTLLSRAVMGGTDIGSDPEGFSGYGPARYFTPAQVTELAAALGRPELEAEAATRFNARRMAELDIYPGEFDDPDDAEWVLDGVRKLRDFYADAARKGRAIVTSLV